MGRPDKLYKELDDLVGDYRLALVRELEKENTPPGQSLYLEKKKVVDDNGRIDVVRSKTGNAAEANEVLNLEKAITRLCHNLKEPLPQPFEILDEYLAASNKLTAGIPAWKINRKEVEAMDRNLRKVAIERLR